VISTYESLRENSHDPKLTPEHRLHLAIASIFVNDGKAASTFAVLKAIADAGLRPEIAEPAII
jgi:hypothetical protein